MVEDDKASEWTDARESADEVRGVGSWEDQEHALEHAGNRAQTQSLVGGPSGSKATLKGEVGPLRDPSVQWSFQDPVWGRDYSELDHDFTSNGWLLILIRRRTTDCGGQSGFHFQPLIW